MIREIPGCHGFEAQGGKRHIEVALQLLFVTLLTGLSSLFWIELCDENPIRPIAPQIPIFSSIEIVKYHTPQISVSGKDG